MILRGITLLLAVLALAALVVLPGRVGSHFRRDVPPPAPVIGTDPVDVQALHRLREGYEYEGAGQIEMAKGEYVAALAGKASDLQAAATRALERLRARREWLGWSGDVVLRLAAMPFALRLSLGLLLVLIVYGTVREWVFRPKGTRVAEFPVLGCGDPTAARTFQEAFLTFSGEVKRVYGAEFSKRLGLAVSFDGLQGSTVPNAGVFERALAEARTADAKAVTRFALSEAVQWLTRVTERAPAIVITGTVQLVPGGARATARLRDHRVEDEETIEASTDELAEFERVVGVCDRLLGESCPRPFVASPHDEAEDRRRTTSQLRALALVLACKVRHRESAAVQFGARPGSWKTVCAFTAAGAALD
jgi:hypothetical protein